ncbi:MAG: hypothetical protein CL566_04000 [Alphaproteobacteria bacterium]|nr:hypothetical protein [Alphaproteobacteria bacterium]
MPRLSYLLSLTPRETWRILRHRLPGLRGGPAWTVNELMSSPKHARGIRFAELLARQEAIAAQHMSWQPLDFEGRRVVEIGCGPLAGFGPLAIFRGASNFESAEPEWDPALLRDPAVVDTYLRVFHADLVALYGPRIDFATFRDALDARLSIHRCGFEAAAIEGAVDIVLSQSVLEHVFPLDDTVAKLAEIQAPQTRFLHLVDFGNHYPTASPYDGLYEKPPEAYIEQRGKAINLLRAPDIVETFAAHGIAATLIPTRKLPGQASEQIGDWWRERYDDDALFTQLALVVGPGDSVA